MLNMTDHGRVRELQIDRPPANALNGELLRTLQSGLATAAAEADAVVLSGRPGMFSAGLDVPELLDLDREEFAGLWREFIGLQRTIATLPVPIAFALTGHAPAGGILLAVYGDYRVMPSGPFKTGLNEVKIGLVVPETPFRALRRLVGPVVAGELVLGGEMITSDRAAAIGLVDELVDSPAAAVAAALAWCERHLALPRDAMLASRAMARADLHALFEGESAARGDRFIEFWFSEDTRRRLRALVASLGK
jgi:enoyl-CoA hydratase/carnithine racemase